MITKPKLYVLDDDALHADLLVDVAINAGWQAISEQSAKAFLQIDFTQNGILVLDLIMPEMDGIEVIRSLAEKEFHWPIILVSGFDSRVLHSAKKLAEAYNITVLANLTKPLSIQNFMNVLNNVEELQLAIEQHQLMLHFQPQLDMKNKILKQVLISPIATVFNKRYCL